MQRHLGLLALAFAVTGLGSVVVGIVLALCGLLGGAALFTHGTAAGGAAVSGLFVAAGVVVAIGGAPQVLAWYGVSRRAPWGRLLAIVLCAISLGAFPIGTAFGAWGLWVLLSSDALRAFRIERSWLSDGAALVAGLFLSRDRRDERRRERGNTGCGGGALLALLLIAGLATCGTCARAVAARVPGVRGVDDTAWSSAAGDPAGTASDATANGAAHAPPGSAPPGSASPGSAPPSTATGDANDGAPFGGGAAPGSPTGSVSTTTGGGTVVELHGAPAVGDGGTADDGAAARKVYFTFTDKDGVPHIVDDERKIPPAYKGGAHRQ